MRPWACIDNDLTPLQFSFLIVRTPCLSFSLLYFLISCLLVSVLTGTAFTKHNNKYKQTKSSIHSSFLAAECR